MDNGVSFGLVLIVAGGFLLMMFITAGFYASRYRKVGPNQALVISGSRRPVRDPETGQQKMEGYRIVSGGGTFILPVIERVDVLSLEPIALDFAVEGQYRDGAEARVSGQAQIAIGREREAIDRAAARFLSKSAEEVAEVARQLLAVEVRAYTKQVTAGEMRDNLPETNRDVARAWEAQLAKLGLTALALDVARVA